MNNDSPSSIATQQLIPQPSSNTTQNISMSASINVKANLFKRFLALGIDMIFLGLVGILLAIPFGGVFFTFGQHGWWIGFLIALLYFSIAETSITKGQTLGGKILGLSVVTVKGSYLNIGMALVRNFLLLLVVFFNNIGTIVPLSNTLIFGIYDIILFSYVVAFFVFILFHPHHRGMHDLASEAIVVKKKEYEKLNSSDRSQFATQIVSAKKAINISAILVTLIILSGIIVMIINPLKNSFFSDLFTIHNAINKDPGVQDSTVSLNTFADTSDHSTKILLIVVQVNRNTFIDPNKLKMLDLYIKKQAATLYPHINQIDQIQTVFNSGYNIGIWEFHETFSGSPVSPQTIK